MRVLCVCFVCLTSQEALKAPLPNEKTFWSMFLLKQCYNFNIQFFSKVFLNLLLDKTVHLHK